MRLPRARGNQFKMVTQSESVNLADDRILEIQLFEQLERRAQIRLCELMRLRRVSRNQNVLLIDAAFREGRVSKQLATDITTDLGLNWTAPGPRTELSGDELDHSDSMLDESESLLDWMPEPPSRHTPPRHIQKTLTSMTGSISMSLTQWRHRKDRTPEGSSMKARHRTRTEASSPPTCLQVNKAPKSQRPRGKLSQSQDSEVRLRLTRLFEHNLSAF